MKISATPAHSGSDHESAGSIAFPFPFPPSAASFAGAPSSRPGTSAGGGAGADDDAAPAFCTRWSSALRAIALPNLRQPESTRREMAAHRLRSASARAPPGPTPASRSGDPPAKGRTTCSFTAALYAKSNTMPSGWLHGVSGQQRGHSWRRTAGMVGTSAQTQRSRSGRRTCRPRQTRCQTSCRSEDTSTTRATRTG